MKFNGKILEERRKDLNLTQAEVAELIGVTQPVIHYYETGKVTPSAGVLFRIAELISVSTDKLLGLEVRGDVGSVQHEAVGHPI